MTTARFADVGISKGPALPEFITIVAAMMAMTALSIDIMLPALPAMSDYFGLETANERQFVLTAYLIGFAAGQLFHGPLSDRFGRKPILIIGLLIYAVATIGTFAAHDFSLFLAARALQGIGGASPRVMALAVVRDLFHGREMARVMSFVMMVFIIVPVIAPSVGQGLLFLGNWQLIFVFLLVASLLILLLTVLRLPETRPKSAREPMSVAWLAKAFWRVLSTRQTIGYTVAIAFIFGCLMSYVSTAQQVLEGIYGLDKLFPILFGAIAIAMAAASVTNGTLVERFGMRRMSHTALVAFFLVAVIQVLVATLSDGPPPLWLFAGLLAIDLFCFGFIMPNFNSLAMEPLRSIAGTGSSFIGFFTTGGAAILGAIVGQHFNDTVIPLALGYLVFSGIALVAVFITERGKLFQPHTGA